MFYGITLGLVAVGVWGTFASVNDKVDTEAQIVGSLYRDVGTYQEPQRTALRQDLARYLKTVVAVSWPLQPRKQPVVHRSARFQRLRPLQLLAH